MAEITITANCSAGFICSGGATFDHAALVAAGRSRADGLDFYMRHTTAGIVLHTGESNINTASCHIAFVAVTTSASDAGYRLGFGDLGWQTDRTVAGGAYLPSGSVTTYSVPALTLPPPAHALTAVKRYRRAESAGGVYRRRDLNENPQWVYLAAWRNISPEDWYEIRAWVAASRGGAGVGSFAWATGNYRPLPGTLSLTKDSAGQYNADLELEEAVA